MTPTLLRAADRAAVPWKNGGGVTHEVAAWPPGAGFDDFDWRISIAEVGADGPFSSFPDVDRILAVLDGRLRLAVAGRAETVLSADTPPANFPGDVPTEGRVEAGPVMDLNLMRRRGRGRARLERLDVLLPQAVGPLAPTVVVIAAGGPLRVVAPAAAFDLERYDALLIHAGDSLLVEALHPVVAYVASFEAD